jgi:uncharacterized protein YlxW (UPF0749 family)
MRQITIAPARRRRATAAETARLLHDLRADVERLESRVTELQDKLSTSINRVHAALDVQDRLQRELTDALVKAAKWDALQAIVEALTRHPA